MIQDLIIVMFSLYFVFYPFHAIVYIKSNSKRHKKLLLNYIGVIISLVLFILVFIVRKYGTIEIFMTFSILFFVVLFINNFVSFISAMITLPKQTRFQEILLIFNSIGVIALIVITIDIFVYKIENPIEYIQSMYAFNVNSTLFFPILIRMLSFIYVCLSIFITLVFFFNISTFHSNDKEKNNALIKKLFNRRNIAIIIIFGIFLSLLHFSELSLLNIAEDITDISDTERINIGIRKQTEFDKMVSVIQLFTSAILIPILLDFFISRRDEKNDELKSISERKARLKNKWNIRKNKKIRP
jgi:hypothetical protein